MIKNTGFPALAGHESRILILGSFPGIRSLEARQYYAHPQNVFWKIMGSLFGAGQDIPYPARMKRLRENGIALWDVLRICERPGSMDGAIVEKMSAPNDFSGFFGEIRGIAGICFNGKKAARLYERLVIPTLDEDHRNISRYILPSTSPAYASMQFEEKAILWKQSMAMASLGQEPDQDIPGIDRYP